ncbi:ABC transporter permease [Alkalilimnicola ehrlichii]|uniref:ABC transporter permease n=1 Tax=Alkalilimnicola ehrlichii TaxID=351052 RepID=UPI003BA03690
MNALRLTLNWLRFRPLPALLNLLLMALGTGTIALLLLYGHQLERQFTRDAQGIDLVVGASGSPMQLILSSVYHLDIPTGNIPERTARELADHRLVSEVIPLALGDNYRGHRIVGTDAGYVDLYRGELAEGRLWEQAMEATLGSAVAARHGLAIGDEIVGAHGLGGGHGHVHDYAPYTVVGILAPTGTVMDRLVLTSVQSVWDVHDDDHDHDHEHDHEHDHSDHPEAGHGHDHEADRAHTHEPAPDHDHGHPAGQGHDHREPGAGHDDVATADQELTALLVRYRSPLAAMQLPRAINAEAGLQAASPAYESARLMSMMGVGLDTLKAFGGVLLLAAGLGVFIGLYNALRERRHDIAIIRSLGASPRLVSGLVLLEGQLLALTGTLLGLAGGHLSAELIGRWIGRDRPLELTGLTWVPSEGWLLLIAAGIGLVAALLPAWQAYRTDIALTLSER